MTSAPRSVPSTAMGHWLTTIAMVVVCVPSLCGCHRSNPRGAKSAPAPQPAHSGKAHHGSRDIGDYIRRMESADRAAWQKPDEVIAALNLRPGERIADVGCGPGYFTLLLAEAVGPTGKVWAIDVKAEMLDRLREHIAKRELSNIEPQLVPENDPRLTPGQVDTVFIVNTYHHFSYRPVYVSKLRRALAPGGRIVIIDFIPKSREQRGFGPKLEMQLDRATVDGEMAASGLQPAAVHTFLPEQYFVEYRARE